MSDEAETIRDAKGRVLKLRKLNVLDQVRLLRAIGAEHANNEPYANLVYAAAMVDEIDGVPQPIPTNERSIDAAFARIGDEGLAAITVHLRTQIAAAERAAEEAADAPRDPLPAPALSPTTLV